MNNTKLICIETSKKLSNFDFVISQSLKKCNYIPYINAHPWDATTLSHGFPGLIILFTELDNLFPQTHWAALCHQAISQLIENIKTVGLHNFSLFSGLTGICYSIYLASKQGKRYSNLLTKLHKLLIQGIKKEYIETIKNDPKILSNPLYYDLITGVNGVLSYLLYHQENKEIHTITKTLITNLIQLTHSITIEGVTVPGWYIAPAQYLRETDQEHFVKGMFDTGIAHGIAGCLATLSQCKKMNIKVPGIKKAIENITYWLKGIRSNFNNIKKVWGGKLQFCKESPTRANHNMDFYRDGWCYGAPGIVSALFLAADVLNDADTKMFAHESLQEICNRTIQEQTLDCVSFCHGNAGLLTILSYVKKNILLQDTSNLQKAIDVVHERILSQFDENTSFGFKCLASTLDDTPPILIDNPGLLDGVVGTALALLYKETEKKQQWTQIFGLY